MSLATLFLIIALVLFIVAVFDVALRDRLIAAGLACCVVSVLMPVIA
jgi:hypothetical protein